MIELFETLDALETHKTMHKTATALRVSQPTVSKRVALLEHRLGLRLLQKDGRGVLLTPEGQGLLQRVRPLLAGLKEVLSEKSTFPLSKLNLGFSESILGSWGAQAMARLSEESPELRFYFHAHRSPVVIDRVRSGEYLFGVCAGFCAKAPDLQVQEVGREKMIWVQSKKRPLAGRPLMSIEKSSETWVSIATQMKKEKLQPTVTLESFSSIAQLANCGLVEALVPSGVSKCLIKPTLSKRPLKITRPIVLIGRKSTFSRPELKGMVQALAQELSRELERCNQSP